MTAAGMEFIVNVSDRDVRPNIEHLSRTDPLPNLKTEEEEREEVSGHTTRGHTSTAQ